MLAEEVKRIDNIDVEKYIKWKMTCCTLLRVKDDMLHIIELHIIEWLVYLRQVQIHHRFFGKQYKWDNLPRVNWHFYHLNNVEVDPSHARAVLTVNSIIDKVEVELLMIALLYVISNKLLEMKYPNIFWVRALHTALTYWMTLLTSLITKPPLLRREERSHIHIPS